MKKYLAFAVIASSLMAGTSFGNDGPGSNGTPIAPLLGFEAASAIVANCAGRHDDSNLLVGDAVLVPGIFDQCIEKEMKKLQLKGDNCGFNDAGTLNDVIDGIARCQVYTQANPQ